MAGAKAIRGLAWACFIAVALMKPPIVPFIFLAFLCGRVRGYKFMDDYADHLGFGEQNYGASVLCVVDPDADKLNAMTCFADPHEGVDFLKFKRRKL